MAASATITHKVYSSDEVGLVYRAIEAGRGEKEFDIQLDNKPNVRRTADIDKFYDYEEFLRPETYCVTFRLFQGKSRTAESYVLTFPGINIPAPVAVPAVQYMEQPVQRGFRGFGGIDSEEGLEGLIAKTVDAKKLEWDFAQLKKEHTTLQTEFQAVLKENGDLEKQLESTNSNNAKLGMLGTIAGPFFDNMLASSNKLKGTALGNLLAPIDVVNVPHQAHDFGDASFAPVASQAPVAEPGMMEFCQYITTTFTPDEFQEIAGVVGAMGRDKSLINTVVGLLK